ncbi:ABC transporter substrate-binding protein [bacterium]|nr:ABC transporter substrate-binding protein [bacterium]
MNGRAKSVFFLIWCMALTICFVVCFVTCSICRAAEETYKIGAIFSITGSGSWLGEPERNTAKMIEDKVNAAGGINGHPIELIIYDSEGDETKAVLNAKKLIEKDGVLAIIGPSQSGCSLAIIPIVEEAGVPNLSCAAAAKITDPVKKWVFKVTQSDSFCAERMFEYMLKRGITKVAIMSVSSGYGDSGRMELQKAAKNMGITIVADERYSGKDTDMVAQLTKIKGTDAQAIVNWSVGPTQVIVTKNVRQLGLNIPLFQSSGFGSTKNIEQAGSSAEGVMVPVGRILVAELLPDSHYQKKVLMDYKKEYESRFGTEVSTFGGHAYDALYIVLEAIKAVGPDRAKIREYIENSKGFVGIADIYNFSATDHCGLTKDAFEMLMVKDGRFVIVD